MEFTSSQLRSWAAEKRKVCIAGCDTWLISRRGSVLLQYCCYKSSLLFQEILGPRSAHNPTNLAQTFTLLGAPCQPGAVTMCGPVPVVWDGGGSVTLPKFLSVQRAPQPHTSPGQEKDCQIRTERARIKPHAIWTKWNSLELHAVALHGHLVMYLAPTPYHQTSEWLERFCY